MRDESAILAQCLDQCRVSGGEHVQCILERQHRHGLTAENADIRLCSSTWSQTLDIHTLIGQRRGNATTIDLDADSCRRACDCAVATALSAPADTPWHIAPAAEPKQFQSGAEAPNQDLMHRRLKEFLAWLRDCHPSFLLGQAVLEHVRTVRTMRNTNGAELHESLGVYELSAVLSNRDQHRVPASFRRIRFSRTHLADSLANWEGWASLLLHTGRNGGAPAAKPFPETGRTMLIVTPHCLPFFLNLLRFQLSEKRWTNGISRFHEKLGNSVSFAPFSLHSCPRSEWIHKKYFITAEGFEAGDGTVIQDGILRSFIPSRQGGERTGVPYLNNSGDRWVVKRGARPLDQLIGGVDQGILLGRMAGAKPNAAGTFSGVAKNSFLVENGKVKHPLKETSVSGNIADILMNMCAISRERVDFGDAILPWVLVADVAVTSR